MPKGFNQRRKFFDAQDRLIVAHAKQRKSISKELLEVRNEEQEGEMRNEKRELSWHGSSAFSMCSVLSVVRLFRAV